MTTDGKIGDRKRKVKDWVTKHYTQDIYEILQNVIKFIQMSISLLQDVCVCVYINDIFYGLNMCLSRPLFPKANLNRYFLLILESNDFCFSTQIFPDA